MLRCSPVLLRVQSHQKKRALHPNAGTRYGRVYNRGFVRYGFGGFGMSVYSTKKDRRFTVEPMLEKPLYGSLSPEGGLSPTTKALSPNFRAFALADGGVLFLHPSHRQVMQWGQAVLQEETKATGMTAFDEMVNSRLQSMIADNTIENTAITHWRRQHMWNLVKSHGRLQRRWGTPDFVKGARSTLYNN
ncbi:hypothetical protein AGDE_01917 [Angomonas deanei]|uniref:Uncharacterized protein n=1 Tax=Angomonas deanei TaxID=59799 RepID=S9UH66_9TRYP|nr:hypothetical protein AGDE_09604 [Angomonas deanei]EPY38684.1 hypothetical protein AGDE_05245 [Angomonas deanei]EPY42006.1 hypothetical protein AGDE_01917 [Angomonas deanei]CAD2212856.1 hypothetical protein, conserved [Angomonas deanei]|eukprot:EPY30117.1 hypothetical protein AGDE_09604 [Angomonas deanei]